MLLVAVATCAFVIPDLRHPDMMRDPSWELVRGVSSSRVTHAIDNDDVRLLCTSDVSYVTPAVYFYVGPASVLVLLVVVVLARQ